MEAFNKYPYVKQLYNQAMGSREAKKYTRERLVASACVIDGTLRIFTARNHVVLTLNYQAVTKAFVTDTDGVRFYEHGAEIESVISTLNKELQDEQY